MRLALPGAKLFKKPGVKASATVIAPWTVVTATDTGGDLWTGVSLPNGTTGWISDDDLYETIGYRMVIEKLRAEEIEVLGQGRYGAGSSRKRSLGSAGVITMGEEEGDEDVEDDGMDVN